MAMSRDRVEFYLPSTYFGYAQTGMSKATCKEVLLLAFGMCGQQSSSLMSQFPTGFHIRCRPSQFARFIVYRHKMGNCINGIKDLAPDLVKPQYRDFYALVAEEVGAPRHTVSRVLEVVGVVNKFPHGSQECDLVDVSKNDAS